MNEIETTLSDIKLFIEQLKADLPEVFTKEQEKQQTQGKILYMGNLYTPLIEVVPGAEPAVLFEDQNIIITIPEESFDISELAENWLRTQAEITLKERTKEWAAKMGIEYNNVFIKDQKTMWGSCSDKKNINFSYRIIKMPVIIMDYLIVHELAHIVHMNHAQEYWSLVAQYSPDYNEHRKWLNNNRAHIMADTKIKYLGPALPEEEAPQQEGPEEALQDNSTLDKQPEEQQQNNTETEENPSEEE
ncbi:hypothetical protein Dip510_000796 [Elusimicrobium posterum]|uniref:M48 family metallopeptidase n=1 Tax=Elusimicrobium posterum TaxID=3116653 RepID=UPI003C712583